MLQQTLKAAIIIIIIAVGASLFINMDIQQKPMNISGSDQKPAILQQMPQQFKKEAPLLANSSVRGTEYLTTETSGAFSGHFIASIEINGALIKSIVDTGATLIAFGAQDAEKAGIRPAQSEYRYRTQTANGEVAVARVLVPLIRLGSIELENVEASVLPEGALSGTLLGMSFLKRLQVQTENGKMVLKQ